MDMATITIGHDADQEVAARYMQKYDLELLPVIDSGRRILGVITVDDIIDVLSDEASEDMYRMVGVGDPKPLSHGPFERAYKRLPWLITTIVGMGIIAPFMLNHLFADTLMRVASLALFIPAIMGLGGNTAIQSSTITVRGLATGEIDFDDLFWMIKREIQVGLIIAVVCAVAVGTCAFGVTSMDNLTAGAAAVSALRFGVTVSIAMFVGIISSVLLGTTVPMLCHRFGIDPAVAAGPFITTIIDMGTQTLYLTVATLLLLA
jgi:magnesium transporter